MTDNTKRTPDKDGRAPLISIVLPVYNGEKYLAEAIESVLAQTFADFELIMIDDGSTDHSLEILREYEKSDPRVRVVARENLGIAATLNESIKSARGTWIARMDQDDVALPYRLQKQLEFLKLTGYDICGGAVRYFGSKQSIWRYPETAAEVEVHLLFDVPYAHPAVLCKTELITRLGYAEAYVGAEDYDLWQRAWAHGAKGGNVSDVLLQYRVHRDQMSSVQKERQGRLASLVRKRHWMAMTEERFEAEIEEIIKALSGGAVRFETVFPALVEVGLRCDDMVRPYFLNQAFRLAVRTAATSTCAWGGWRRLMEHFNVRRQIGREMFLFALWAVRVGPGNPLFEQIKACYFRWRG